MHTNQTYNSLVIDNPELPFPPEIAVSIKDINWGNISWNSIGFPAFDSSFCLTGDQLYFESGKDGAVKLKASDFTGQAVISGIVIPNNPEEIFKLVFELTFYNGTLKNAELKEFKTESYDSYLVGFNKFKIESARDEQMRKSKLFRFLYKPY